MGTKGKSPRFTLKKSTVRTRVKAGTGTGGVTTNSSLATEQCWTFPLDGVTPAGRKAPKGEQVNGILNGSRLLVIASMGTLGYVPVNLSAQIQSVLKRLNATLAGEVLIDGKTGSIVMVQLCIN